MTRLILASQSSTRAKILEGAGVSFETLPASVDEDAVKDSMLAARAGPRAIADALAEFKALQVSQSQPDAVVIGADLILTFDGELVSKSENLEDARALLCRLRGRSHELFCAAVLACNGEPVWRHVDRAVLRMRTFSDTLLDSYLGRHGTNLLGGVGCYRIEDEGIQLIECIDGDYFAILGLPLLPLLGALRAQGVVAK